MYNDIIVQKDRSYSEKKISTKSRGRAYDLSRRLVNLSPLAVGEGENRSVGVAPERSEHPPLGEVNKVHLPVHAACHRGIQVDHVLHARHRARVHLNGAVPVEIGRLSSVLVAFAQTRFRHSKKNRAPRDTVVRDRSTKEMRRSLQK